MASLFNGSVLRILLYKGYSSVVTFAVCVANRRAIYVQVWKPRVPGDATILERSSLLSNIESGKQIEPYILTVRVWDVNIKLFLLGDCAFKLTTYMMRYCIKPKKKADSDLKLFDSVACSAHKPIERMFGIIKFHFSILKYGGRLLREEYISFLATASVILYNMSINSGDKGGDETICDDEHQLYSKRKV